MAKSPCCEQSLTEGGVILFDAPVASWFLPPRLYFRTVELFVFIAFVGSELTVWCKRRAGVVGRATEHSHRMRESSGFAPGSRSRPNVNPGVPNLRVGCVVLKIQNNFTRWGRVARSKRLVGQLCPTASPLPCSTSLQIWNKISHNHDERL